LYVGEPVLSTTDFNPGAFRWVNAGDRDHSTLSFLRLDPKGENVYLVIGNFTPVTRTLCRVGVPEAGRWSEVLNSNASVYGGAGFGNYGGQATEAVVADGQAQSLVLTLPGLSTLVLKWNRTDALAAVKTSESKLAGKPVRSARRTKKVA
ncbi:MAG: alpha amylase C-terminal domain-containing protein, partial [Candidatus Didemnitutus sp.]|nr:alpha amylase C-terminal domain-containing protein [Candidatus Didemnitutus sp.]